MCDAYSEVYFSQKFFTNRLKMGLSLRVWVDKTVYWVETLWFTSKEVPNVVVSKKKGHCDNLLEQEKIPDNWFSWKKGQL